MHVDIAVAARLQFLDREEEFLIQLLVELVEDQRALGGHQRGVRVGVLLVADVHDRLALAVDLIEHVDEVLLVVAVIAVALGDSRVDRLQRGLNDVVHFGDGDLVLAHLQHAAVHKGTDLPIVLVGKGDERSVGGFGHGSDDLLYVVVLACAVFFNDADHGAPPYLRIIPKVFLLYHTAICSFKWQIVQQYIDFFSEVGGGGVKTAALPPLFRRGRRLRRPVCALPLSLPQALSRQLPRQEEPWIDAYSAPSGILAMICR